LRAFSGLWDNRAHAKSNREPIPRLEIVAERHLVDLEGLYDAVDSEIQLYAANFAREVLASCLSTALASCFRFFEATAGLDWA
jgi:hypothetical protein